MVSLPTLILNHDSFPGDKCKSTLTCIVIGLWICIFKGFIYLFIFIKYNNQTSSKMVEIFSNLTKGLEFKQENATVFCDRVLLYLWFIPTHMYMHVPIQYTS